MPTTDVSFLEVVSFRFVNLGLWRKEIVLNLEVWCFTWILTMGSCDAIHVYLVHNALLKDDNEN